MPTDEKIKYAEYLRKNATASERMMCHKMTKASIPFEFQPVIYGYIPDFSFPNHKGKLLELDGKFHKGRQEQDAKRDRNLLAAGFQVLRIPSFWVFHKPKRVMTLLRDFLNNASVARAQKKHSKKKTPLPRKVKSLKKARRWQDVPRLSKDNRRWL